MKKKNIASWIFSVFFLISCFVFIPSIASIVMLFVALLLAPISQIQKIRNKIFPKKWLRTLLLVVLIFASVILAPTDTNSSEEDLPEKIETVQTEKEKTDTPEASETPEEPENPTEIQLPGLTEDSTFEIQFIDVGQADSALILCDGRAMLIDGGNRGDSSTLYSVLKNRNITHLDYLVATHAHEDHIGGLPGALNFSTVGTVFSPTLSYDSDTFDNFVKYVSAQNKELTVPSVGDTFSLGSAEIKILAVNSVDDDNTNNTSIVLRVTYGNTSFLFTGDAEREVEEIILDNESDLSSTVLKVGHHGSETSTSYVFLREVMPKYAIISVGEGNTYGHPTDETLSRLRDANVNVFRTDLQGDIKCVSDGEDVSFTVSKNINADVFEAPDLKTENTYIEEKPVVKEDETATSKKSDYVLNTNTKKFHYPDCRHVNSISDENREEYSGAREELIKQKYDPCGTCHP